MILSELFGIFCVLQLILPLRLLVYLQDKLAECKSAGMDVELEVLTNPLLAVQGPLMSQVSSQYY